MDVDLYEFKETLGSLNDLKDIEETEKRTGLIEVGKLPKDEQERLINQGYDFEDKIMVIIQ